MNPAPVKLYFKQTSFLITMERELAQGSTLFPPFLQWAAGSQMKGCWLNHEKLLKSSFVIPVCTTNNFVWGSMVDPSQIDRAQL